MSKIRFEWDIESQRIDRSDGEDPLAKRRRRRNIARLLLILAMLVAMIALGALIVRQRLIDVENHFAQLLQDTVKAEVAALRIGDINSWLAAQATEPPGWIGQQRAAFQQYSDLKAAGAIDLTGGILSVRIEGERARVLVQENIHNLPYSRLWFYRRTNSGWLHSAPDYSFWGEPRQYVGAGVRVAYRAVDQQFATELGPALEDWLRRACDVFDCGDLPLLNVNVTPDSESAAGWRDERTLRLDIRSPYLERARADAPFDGAYQQLVSQILAERIINAHTNYRAAAYPHDAFYLRGAVTDWLAAYMTRKDGSNSLLDSLAANYGAEAMARLLANLSATDSMAVLQHAIPVPLAQADLDWRDFIAWRLKLESELIAARAEEAWLQLYDTSDDSVRRAAYARFNRNAPPQAYKVADHYIGTSDAGEPQLRASAKASDASQQQEAFVLFNLVNGVWKRAN
ncbi:MAG: hypothetical protein F4X02_15400 [Chloroflexi bacterium]|nr:hypothetical protein [Chloroflexota bacterium]